MERLVFREYVLEDALIGSLVTIVHGWQVQSSQWPFQAGNVVPVVEGGSDRSEFWFKFVVVAETRRRTVRLPAAFSVAATTMLDLTCQGKLVLCSTTKVSKGRWTHGVYILAS